MCQYPAAFDLLKAQNLLTGWLVGRQLLVAVLDEVVQWSPRVAGVASPGVEELRRQRREIERGKDLVDHEEGGRRAAADNAWLMTHAPAGPAGRETGL